MSDLLAKLALEVANHIATFLGATTANTVKAVLPIVATFAVIWFFERRQGSDTSRYRRRHFAHDVAYAWFYNSGAFGLLGASLVYSAVRSQLSFMRLELLEGLPIAVVGLIYLITIDCVSYWIHRAEHAIPLLWQFHSVHHAPEEINFLTAYRVHPFSRLLWGFSEVIVLILLGVPPTWWLPFTLARGFLASVQHTELDWRYGRLYPILVSPVFHRLHHSNDRRDFDSNYSQLFSIWDFLFGTANPSRTPPVAVGVQGLPPEPTLLGQFWGPFRRIARSGATPELPAAPPVRPQNGRRSRSRAARAVTGAGKGQR
jgi:sterol desaturase/sphingolipid hydroxylase (fatty acid hydroxylase superfamily)